MKHIILFLSIFGYLTTGINAGTSDNGAAPIQLSGSGTRP